jgi:hypothetical protein
VSIESADSTRADGVANAEHPNCFQRESAFYNATMIAIQEAPECLRPLFLILSASRLRPIADKTVSGDSKIKRNDELDERKWRQQEAGTEVSSAPLRSRQLHSLLSFLFPNPNTTTENTLQKYNSSRDYSKQFLLERLYLETARRDGRLYTLCESIQL